MTMIKQEDMMNLFEIERVFDFVLAEHNGYESLEYEDLQPDRMDSSRLDISFYFLYQNINHQIINLTLQIIALHLLHQSIYSMQHHHILYLDRLLLIYLLLNL